MAESIRTVFANTPRVMLSSLLAYAICEIYDVWAYHALWNWSEKKTGNHKALLWLRNNGSTLVSQLINVIVFNVAAFAGVFPTRASLTMKFPISPFPGVRRGTIQPTGAGFHMWDLAPVPTPFPRTGCARGTATPSAVGRVHPKPLALKRYVSNG